MFGQSTTEIESKIRELYSKESELSQRQQAVLASTVAGDADAERYMTDPEAAVAALTSASLRARAESDLIEASVSSIRRKRGDLISKVIGKRVADAETARDVKQDELAAAKEETARLHAEYTAAAQAEMRLTGELEAAVYAIQQAAFGSATAAGAKFDSHSILVSDCDWRSGFVEGASVDDVCAKIEALTAVRFVPTPGAVRSWAASLEAVVRGVRNGLLAPHNEIPDAPRDAEHVAVRQPIPLQLRRVYRVVYAGGVIDTEKSMISFPDSAQGTGRSGAEFNLAGLVREARL